MSFTLVQWRKIRDLNQQEVAERLEVSTETLRKWEKQPLEMPVKHFLALCDIYEVDATEVKIENAL